MRWTLQVRMPLGLRTFGGEVEGRRRAASRVAPVDGALPVAVLVVVQHAVLVVARVPVLRTRRSHIETPTQCLCVLFRRSNAPLERTRHNLREHAYMRHCSRLWMRW